MTEEQWRPVVGFDGLYEVSDQGRIRSVARVVPCVNGRSLTVRERIRRQFPNRDGYLTVSLSKECRPTWRSVHLLVLEAFAGPRPEGQEACHANDDKADNRLANLRWDTKSANSYDRVRNGNHNTSRRTHCPSGHAYDEANTRLYGGRRHCHTCRMRRKREYRERISRTGASS